MKEISTNQNISEIFLLKQEYLNQIKNSKSLNTFTTYSKIISFIPDNFLQINQTEWFIEFTKDMDKNNTKAYKRDCINRFITFCNRKGLSIPLIDLTYTKEKIQKQGLSNDDVNKIIKYLINNSSIAEQIAFSIMITSGIRIDEYEELINAMIRTGIRSQYIISDTKNNRSRKILISEKTLFLLSNCEDIKDIKWLSDTTARKNRINLLSKKIGIKFTAHDFRSYFATKAFESGMPETAIQTLMGHSSLTTTKIYIRDMNNTVKFYYDAVFNNNTDFYNIMELREALRLAKEKQLQMKSIIDDKQSELEYYKNILRDNGIEIKETYESTRQNTN